jgi:hypothetical protein
MNVVVRLLILGLTALCSAAHAQGDVRGIAKEAYIYGVPLIDQYRVMHAFSIDKGNPQYKGPFNTILNIARVFTRTTPRS